jgi:hypothetical protein
VNLTYYNEWLDEYNDYILLFEMFGDLEYLEEAQEVLNSLKVFVARNQRHAQLISKVMNNKIQAF